MRPIEILPVIQLHSFHELVERVRLDQTSGSRAKNKLLFDEERGEYVNTTDYLEVELDGEKVTKIKALRPFRWEGWDYTADYQEDDLNSKHVVEYDFEVDFSRNTIQWSSGVVIVQQDGHTDPKNEQREVWFKKRVDFKGVVFASPAIFWDVIFCEDAAFNRAHFAHEALFNAAIFKGYANFRNGLFTGPAYFWDGTFHHNLDFFAAVFRRQVLMQRLKFDPLYHQQDHSVLNFASVTVQDKVLFNLSDEVDYKYLVLGLFESNISNFFCDDNAFSSVQMYWQTPEVWSALDKKLSKRDQAERRVHELRVMRRLFQDLLRGAIADHYYAEIMSAQYDLANPVERYIKKFLFGWCFGWGVYFGFEEWIGKVRKIHNAIFVTQDMRLKKEESSFSERVKNAILFFVPTQGGIIWSSLLVVILFASIYKYAFPQEAVYFFSNEGLKAAEISPSTVTIADLGWRVLLFSAWQFSLVMLPDQHGVGYDSPMAILVTVQSVLGVVWVTTFVAMFSRKFMRM